jgi:hypothetical protein
MAFSDDAKRVLRENLHQAWLKVAAVVAIALAWLPSWEATEYLGITKFWYKVLAVSIFYFIAGTSIVIIFLARSVKDAYERLGPEIPTEKALTELASKFVGVQKSSFKCFVVVSQDGSSDSINDVVLTAFTKPFRKIEYISTTPSLPDGIEGKLEVSAEPRHEGGVRISQQILRSTPRECSWSINFTPDLRPGASVTYRFKQKTLPHSFAFDMDELKRRGDHRQEHFSQNITYPTANYTLRVAFAPELHPESIEYDVWLGRGGVRHLTEFSRVSDKDLFRTGIDEDNRVYGELVFHIQFRGFDM